MPKITVTRHAIEQLRERCDERFPDAITIRLDVLDAFREGRTSTERPSFLEPGSRYGNGGRIRFVWVADESRAYVLRHGKNGWVVLTTLAAAVTEKAAA
jgi:hypothetical protein